MNHRPLGESGPSASIIALGAWVLGGGRLWGQDTRDDESVRAIHAAIDHGVNLIDTAPAYGFGRSEEVVGQALKGRRDRVLLATKCGMWWKDTRGSFFTELDGRPVYRSLRPDTLRIEIEDSLRRLGTDYIDLYQTHWPSVPPDHTAIADTMACLLEMRDQGKIRFIGVCNVSPEELNESRARAPIVSNQFRYSMLHREAEPEVLPLCASHRLATLTYMSLEQGLLSGKIGMDRVFQPSEFRSNAHWNDWMVPANRRRVLELLAGWQDLVDKYGCSLSQLVLAWTAVQPGVTHVLVGARTPAQAIENAHAGVLALTLEPVDVARIRREVIALGQPERT